MQARQLWDRWRHDRHQDAFQKLVGPHLPHVLDVTIRQGCGRDDAEDVLQETLLLLAREKGDAPIGVSGGSCLGCREYEWLGGTGRGRAAVSLRGNGVVSFEKCLFADIEGTLLGKGGARRDTIVHFQACRFENTRLTDSRICLGDVPGYPIIVRDGDVYAQSREAWGAQHTADVVAGVNPQMEAYGLVHESHPQPVVHIRDEDGRTTLKLDGLTGKALKR